MATNFISDLFVTIPTPGLNLQTAEKSPLSNLYNNKYNLATYQYPRDLGSNPGRSHYIVFKSLELSPSTPSPEQISKFGELSKKLGIQSYDKLKEFSKNPNAVVEAIRNNKTTELLNTYEGITKEEAQGVVAKDGSVLQTAKDTGLALTDLMASLVSSQPNATAKESIALYIPDTVNVQYSANYSDVSTSEALGKPYMYAQIGASLYDKYKQYSNGASGSQITANILSDPNLRAFLVDKLGAATGTNLTGLSLNAIGQAFNPQLQVLFSSIGFRSFQFDFTFTPYNQEEAFAVKKIIEVFKYRAAPEIVSNGIFTQSLYQKIPDRFSIQFFSNNKPNSNLPNIGQCVLTGINVDYAPIGWAAYGDGTPVQTKLTLQFQEIEIIDKNKIKAGY